METPLKVFKRGNQIIQIFKDLNPENPRSLDNLGKMICFYKRHPLGDKHNIKNKDFSGWDEIEAFIFNKLNAEVVLRLYICDHSGISISTSPSKYSRIIGFIYATRNSIADWCGVRRITKEVKELVEKHLIEEVEKYNKYLTGDVYGFILKTEGEKEVDFWGFYGNDWKNNGIFDHVDGKFEEWVEA